MGFLDKLFGGLFGKKKEKKLHSNMEPVQPKYEKVPEPAPTKQSTPASSKKTAPPSPPTPKVDQTPQELSFDLEVPADTPEDEIKFYTNYLKLVNQEFELMKDFDVSLSTDKGLDIYNHETDDLVATVTSSESNFKTRTNEYVKKQHRNFDESYIRNLGVLNQLFTRFLISQNRKEKVYAHLVEHENEPKIIKTYLTTKTSGLPGKQLAYGEFFNETDAGIDALTVIAQHEQMGIFDNLDEATITRGKLLSTEYNLVNSQDVLWYFKYLITDCCPRESSGNQHELEKFVNISNNILTMTDFEEANVDGKLNVKCNINGIPFESNNLPEFFSLRLIMDLNYFLNKNFQSSFYIWNWERNPWEQQTFIYFTKEQLEKIPGNSREFHELMDEIVQFYEGS